MKYRVSVSNLVSFACRTGDLVLQAPAGPTALQGIKAHQKIQNEKSTQTLSEVSLKIPLKIGQDEIVLSGRMDLLDPCASPPLIQEIKSTLVAPERIPKSVAAVHWAQLKVYGYCYLLQLRSDVQKALFADIDLCLLWANLSDGTQTRESMVVSFEELESFCLQAVESYLSWIKKVDSQYLQTQSSAKALVFPYEQFSQGQRDMAAATFRAARDTGYLLCEAPTGIGKTVSTLFPALKAIGDKHIKKIAYITAKTSGREVALKTLDDLIASGLKINYLVIQSKALVCHCTNGSCERDELGRCPLTIGFFDRLPDAREELIDNGAIDAELLNEVATKYQVCPFELSLQILPWVTLVICDYNYVFDPLVRLTVFSEPDKRLLLLLDESHNLIDRARNMYSARLTRKQNQAVIKSCKSQHPELAKALKSLTRALDRWAKTNTESEWVDQEAPKTITKAVSRCIEAYSLEATSNPPLPDGTSEWFKELFRYVVIEDLFDDQHRTLTQKSNNSGYRDVELRLVCVNASGYLNKSISLFRAGVAFSATLRPLEYFRQSLGMPDETQGMLLESPFEPDRLGVYVCPYIDTRYRQRHLSSAALVELIHSVYASRRGNYLVFFPSYRYLESVLDDFSRNYPHIETVSQQRSSGAEEREYFLQQFEDGKAMLGFAIMGGVFGEGIDYQGERLIGSILVGTGLPSLGLEQQQIADDYAAMGLNGFDYAYRYPGFTKVLQTAGRVIRSEQDRGVVVLADARFSEIFYQSLYPAHWLVQVCKQQKHLQGKLEDFWQEVIH